MKVDCLMAFCWYDDDGSIAGGRVGVEILLKSVQSTVSWERECSKWCSKISEHTEWQDKQRVLKRDC